MRESESGSTFDFFFFVCFFGVKRICEKQKQKTKTKKQKHPNPPAARRSDF
jgi:hypothetical protein